MARRQAAKQAMTARSAVLLPSRPWSRVVGLGSIFGKTLRDSRRAMLIVGGIAGLFMLATGAPFGSAPEFATIELRRQFTQGILSLPLALRGLLGDPIDIEHMGGFLSWRIGNTLPSIFGLWSVIALSGTLAGEAGKGSLDLLLSTPQGRASVALQKLAGHVVAVAVAMAIFAGLTFLVGQLFARLPGDQIPLVAAIGQGVLFGLLMLASGSIAFATAPFVGRTRALAFGLISLFGGTIINGYSSLSPLIESLRPLSFESWTVGHRPLAGVTDWPSIALLAAVTAAFLAMGVIGFVRRDVGNASGLRWLRLPSLPAGVDGPLRRQLADRAAEALAWGLGVGLYASLIVASAKAFAESIGRLPQIVALVHIVYPAIDFSQPSGILQLTFFGFGSLMLSLAGASFLAGWSGDEGRGRLAVVMSVPVTRFRWMLASGGGVLAAVGIVTLTVAVSVAVAVWTQAGELRGPLIGTAILGLAAAGFTGIGLAVGGLVRASLAAPAAGFAAIATFLLDSLGAALKLPDPVLQLSLFKHLGQPMVGVYDTTGIVAAAALALGGLFLGAFGLQRRDLDR
jgi:ABC-2 type transport system permease protein